MIALTDVELILASTSRYRRVLLERIACGFHVVAPLVDESAHADELPEALATRLAMAKAQAVAMTNPGALVIGSDQVAHLDGSTQIFGKPHTPENARAQLAACSGRAVVFRTALCVIDARHTPHQTHAALDTTRVHFRTLHADEIKRYVEREQPLDCAGSFKCEGLGIALFERIESNDPTALIGLPLIALCRLFRAADIDVV